MNKTTEENFINLIIVFSLVSIAISLVFVVYFLWENKGTDVTISPIAQIKESKLIVKELKDRSDGGICEEMYAEGFEWGVAQHHINWQTEHIGRDAWSREAKAMAWYEFWEKITSK